MFLIFLVSNYIQRYRIFCVYNAIVTMLDFNKQFKLQRVQLATHFILQDVDRNIHKITLICLNISVYLNLSVCSFKEDRFSRGGLSNFLSDNGAVYQITLGTCGVNSLQTYGNRFFSNSKLTLREGARSHIKRDLKSRGQLRIFFALIFEQRLRRLTLICQLIATEYISTSNGKNPVDVSD